MIHQHRPLLVVELPIHARIANEVHDPFLAFVLVEAEAGGEIPGMRFSTVSCLETCGGGGGEGVWVST